MSLQQLKGVAGGSTGTRDAGNPLGPSALCGHSRVIVREGCWNRMPREAVDVLSLEVFKARLDGALSSVI